MEVKLSNHIGVAAGTSPMATNACGLSTRMKDFSYAVVIVTYNRLKMLQKCLECVLRQTILPASIVVVDNHSTDGTGEFLERFRSFSEYKERVIVKHEKKNVGGAGGFHDGLRFAINNTDADWFLLIDDDALLDVHCMERLNPNGANNKSEAYACSVFFKNTDQLELIQRKDKHGDIPAQRYVQSELFCTFTSFCGSMFSRPLVEKIGFPRKDYFLWYDDTEYSLRVLQYSPIVIRTKAYLRHGDPEMPDRRTVVDWRYYYGTRNRLHMLRSHKKISSYLSFSCEVLLVVLLRYLKALVYMKDPEKVRQYMMEAEIFSNGWKDGRIGKLGINRKYFPG